jgi:hypothetical protein
MLRHRALLLGAICALSIPAAAAAEPYAMGPRSPGEHRVVGPTQILYTDADSIFIIRSQEWWSASVKHEEKLLLRSLRLRYWIEHLPPDMRLVFDTLGYPMNRLFTTPVGHTEEWWYYGMMDPPLRFRDGTLLDPDRFEAYLARR